MTTNVYAIAAEIESTIRKGTFDELWLHQQLDRIAPERHEMGSASVNDALVKLVFELRDAALKAAPSTSPLTDYEKVVIAKTFDLHRLDAKGRDDVLKFADAIERASLKAAPSTSPATTGAEMICAERARQMAVEGWTPKHDAQHTTGALAWAAVCYAAPAPVYKQQTAAMQTSFVDPWPSEWADKWDKRPKNGKALAAPNPAERIAMLAKAGALIAAEIDRLRAKTIKGGA